jgi:hypothetical protein
MECGAIRKLAEDLLRAAGGDPANSTDYYTILNGGSDDIYGVSISRRQLHNWIDLGMSSEHACVQFILHAHDEPEAYGAFLYCPNMIAGILCGVKAIIQQKSGVLAA